MKRPEDAINHEKTAAPKVRLTIAYIIVSLMLMCVTLMAVQASRLIYRGAPTALILVFSLAVIWESLYSYRRTHSGEPFGPSGLIYHAAEWIIILLLIKASIYIFVEPQNFLPDLALWQKDFIHTFFTLNYVITVGFTGFIWGLGQAFAVPLSALEKDENSLILEKKGYFQNNREGLKRDLMGLIFAVGGLMLILTAVLNLNLNLPGSREASPLLLTGLLLIYFLLGFMLQAQFQYHILEARWFIQDVPASMDISRRWLTTSLILLLGLALVAILLPTSYSVSLLTLLKIALGYALMVPVYFEFLCLGPFLWAISRLLSLLGLHTESTSVPTSPPITPVLPQANPAVTIPWLELAKSIGFWLVFILVIALAIRYYLSQNKHFTQSLQTSPLARFIFQVWQWLVTRSQKIKGSAQYLVTEGIKRLRRRLESSHPLEDSLLAISNRLPPRQRVLLLYLAMVSWNERSGIRRNKTHTPYEYARSLKQFIPQQGDQIDDITQTFMEARYTRHPLADSQAEQAHDDWLKIQEGVRQLNQY
jgi:hypothetical protein